MACLDLGGERRRAPGEPESDQKASGRCEGARRLRQGGAAVGVAGATAACDPLGEADDRLASGVVTEEKGQQQSQ